MLFLLGFCAMILIHITSSIAQQSDTFKPVINCKEDDCLHVTLTFSYKTNSYKYNLIRNDDLFGSNYKQDSTTNPYYINDKGAPLTAIRIGNSHEGIEGVINVNDELKAVAFDNSTGLHYFKAEEEESRMQTPFIDDGIEAPSKYQIGDIGESGTSRFDGSEPFPVNLTITVDNSTLKKWFSDDWKKFKKHATDITNIASGFYNEVNVRLTLVNVFPLDVKMEDEEGFLGDYILEYKKAVDKLAPVDGHHLYHGLNGYFKHGTGAIGVAFLRGVCIRNYNQGVSTVTYDQVLLGTKEKMALVMTHEIGHNLFLNHDHSAIIGGCSCDDTDGKCIMYPQAAPTTKWSSCSKKKLLSLAKDIGKDPKNCPFIINYDYIFNLFLGGIFTQVFIIIVVAYCCCYKKKKKSKVGKAQELTSLAKANGITSGEQATEISQTPFPSNNQQNFQAQPYPVFSYWNSYQMPHQTGFVNPVSLNATPLPTTGSSLATQLGNAQQNPENVASSVDQSQQREQAPVAPRT